MINKTSRLLYLPVFAAGVPLSFSIVSSGVELVTGSATIAEVTGPFLLMAGVSGVTLLLLGGAIAGLTLQETATIRRLIDGGYWARWPQYRNEEDWRSFAERKHKKEMEGAGFTWLPVIVVTVIMVLIAGGTVLLSQRSGGMSPASLIEVGALLFLFYLVLPLITVGGGLARAWQSNADFRRRQTAPIPTVYIGKDGLYHEDEGYQEFRGLNTRLANVQYKDSSPASLNFTLVVRYRMSAHDSERRMKKTISVRVLSDYREEAKALSERFQREGLIKK